MRSKIAAMAALVGFVFSAEVASAQATTMGVGAHTCGQWMRARQQNTAAARLYESWLGGYLSGLVSLSGRDWLKGQDTKLIFVAMDRSCTENPTDRIASTAKLLAVVLSYAPK